ncbi:hypothetical protein MAP_2783 [Mycobacterium avium subsp. paratuberculosis K-10]|uniref:Uncharacterized protein n=1 Tax=Mycolicibacterium paratuberculosis (strain ATCC BAA-968 / K-10) TaxID=262316 RepID=Q73W77_MYCPA|nr:hypothetical protein MAP_2783 [Mycobacterium avium subsp. paratuberculosis K-10]
MAADPPLPADALHDGNPPAEPHGDGDRFPRGLRPRRVAAAAGGVHGGAENLPPLARRAVRLRAGQVGAPGGGGGLAPGPKHVGALAIPRGAVR